MDEIEPLPTTGVVPVYQDRPRSAPFTVGNVMQSKSTNVTAAYHRLESSSWPTEVTFAEDEVATGEDAGLAFEFDPARVPRPRWTCD